MNLELLILGGYGQFVWPAFIFTFVSCFSLYIKTKKEFQKQEKIFLKEFKQMQTEKIATVKEKEALSGSSIF
jgi:heme exporter protein D